MAEVIGLEVFLGMDSQQLQAELQKAENQLRQFQTQLKKSTDTTEITRLNGQIANLNGTIGNINTAMGNTAQKTNNATQSLVNFSRIAQDAPYGIQGVANNLNPMVESFQRLAATEGGTKNALKAMAQGLIGPAGVGVAIGIVSSLAVTFSKEIKEFFKGPTEELEKFREELNKVANDLNKLIGKQQTKRTQGILLTELIVGGNETQQKEALKKLKDLYSESAAIQNAKLGQNKAYYQTLVNQAAIQGDATAKEKNNIDQLDIANESYIKNEKRRNAELKKITSEKIEGVGFSTRIVSVDEQKARINAEYDVLGNDIKKNIARLQSDTFKQLATITLTPTPETVKKNSGKVIDTLKDFSAALKYELAKQLMDYEKYKKEFAKLDRSYIKVEDREERKIQYTKEVKKATGKDQYENTLGSFLEKDAKRRMGEWEAEQRKVDGLSQSYANFANMLASNVTSGLMSVWDALEQGKNPLDAIGQMFVNIAKSIAAAIIQATIFEAILSAFPELKALFKAGGILSNAFGYSGPRAAGGITNGPSLGLIGEAGPEAIIPLSKLSGMLNTTFNAGAMSGGVMGGNGGAFVLRGNDLVLALQRSNSSLNLRRGGI